MENLPLPGADVRRLSTNKIPATGLKPVQRLPL